MGSDGLAPLGLSSQGLGPGPTWEWQPLLLVSPQTLFGCSGQCRMPLGQTEAGGPLFTDLMEGVVGENSGKRTVASWWLSFPVPSHEPVFGSKMTKMPESRDRAGKAEQCGRRAAGGAAHAASPAHVPHLWP